MARFERRLASVAWLALALGCSGGGDGGGGAQVCSEQEPVQCHDPGSQRVVACCPLSHPVCSADGTQCLESGSGGSAGGSGSAGSGGSVGGSGGSVGGSGGSVGGSGGSVGGSGGSVGGTGGGGTGGTGGTGGGGTGGTGGTPSCDDPGFEPNDTQALATDFGTIDDCDGSGSSVSAKLDGASDVDYYTYFGTDVAGCAVDATATTGEKVRLCLFADCSGGSVSCTQGSPAPAGGLPGCCAASGGTVQMGVNCSGFSDDAQIYMRVDQPSGDVCTPYTVDFHY